MNTLQAIAHILKTEGIEWIGCFPSNNLIEAVAQEGIRPMMFRQERGALMAADGFSRLNNRKTFGVVITQGGPGAENAMGGLAQAYGDNVPILYFAGGPALNQRDVRPNFSPVRTYQTVSVSGEVIWKPDMVAAVLRRAFHRLRNGRPGPVIVEVPNDIGTQEVPAASFQYQPPKRHPQAPSSSAVREPLRLLLAAKKPLIQSGMGTLWPGPAPSPRARRAPRHPCTAPCRASRASTSAIRWPSARAAGPRVGTRARGSRSVTSSWLWARASPAPGMGSRSRTARS
jgi:thiamine pyrophosphate-dependent acetolactate synthase large subunit-like protein